jgi:predicted O-methyltransferase YrrM
MTMNKELWTEVDRYLIDTIIQPDAAVSAALAASVAAGLPEIAVSPNLGKFLHLLARMIGAKRILEI